MYWDHIIRYASNKTLWVVALILLASACTSSDDDGGLIGTGLGITTSSGIPVYHSLTETDPTTQEPASGGTVMNLGPLGSIPGTCPSLLRSVEVERDAGWTSPSDLLLGNWQGTTSEGETVIVVITEDDIAHGNRTASVSLRSNTALEIVNADTQGVASSDSVLSVFSYTVTVPGSGNSEAITFLERYELVDTDTLIYTTENEQFGNDSVQLDRANPADLLRPPLWLQGSWANECETRTVSENGIVSTSTQGAVDLGVLFSGESSTFRVHYVDEDSYRFTATFKNQDDGTHQRVSEEYELVSPDGIRLVSGDLEKELSRN